MSSQPRQRRLESSVNIRRQDKVASLIYIDDRELLRDCLAPQMSERLPEFSVTAVAKFSASSAPADGARACVVLYNTHLHRVEDVEFLRDLPVPQSAESQLRVVVLSELDSRENILRALRHGVTGYILTSMSLNIVCEVIRLVHAGGTFIPSIAVLDPEVVTPSERQSTAPAAELRGFTPREVEVLRKLSVGKQNKAIAFELNMSESTVKVHLHHIMRKLQATNRMQVIIETRQLFERQEASNDMQRAPDGAATDRWPIDLARGAEVTL